MEDNFIRFLCIRKQAMYGYGRVAMSNMGGVVFGLILARDQSSFATNTLAGVGLVLMAMGATFTITRRNPITGVMGGMLTGIGFGVSLASYVWH